MSFNHKFIHFFLSPGLITSLLSFALVFSAIAKCFPISYFEITLVQQGLVSNRETAYVLARLIIGAELGLGMAILLNGYRKYASLLCLLMLFVFSLHLLMQMSQGTVTDCGCLGKRFPTSPDTALIKNSVLIFLSAILFYRSHNKANKALLWVLPLLWGALLSFSGIKPHPSPSLAPFAQFSIPSIQFETSEKIILAFLDVDCAHCFSMGVELSKYTNVHPDIQIGIYFLGDPEGIRTFFRDIGHTFPHKILSPEDFYSFVEETPPLVVYIKNGVLIAKDNFLKTKSPLRTQF